MKKYDKSELRDAQGRYRTQSLFFETNLSNLTPIFTLKEHDHTYDGKTYISLRQLYLEYAHAPIEGEYDFAIEVFGSWKHWQKICNAPYLQEHLEEWREELAFKKRTQAIKAIHQTATTEGSKGTAAAKWIAEEGWRGSQRKRVSKAEKDRQEKLNSRISDEVNDIAKRLEIH